MTTVAYCITCIRLYKALSAFRAMAKTTRHLAPRVQYRPCMGPRALHRPSPHVWPMWRKHGQVDHDAYPVDRLRPWRVVHTDTPICNPVTGRPHSRLRRYRSPAPCAAPMHAAPALGSIITLFPRNFLRPHVPRSASLPMPTTERTVAGRPGAYAIWVRRVNSHSATYRQLFSWLHS